MEKNKQWFSSITEWDKNLSKKTEIKKNLWRNIAITFALSGNGQPWIILSILFFIFNIFLDRYQNLMQIMMILLAGIITAVIKHSVKRSRPSEEISKIFISKGDHFSFPSGHASRTSCLAVLITCYFPTIGWFFIIWALIVCYSRVALQLHYLLDILAGILLGAILGVTGFLLTNSFEILLTPLIDWLSKFI